MARRQAGDTRRRHFLAAGVPEEPPDAVGLLPARHQSRADRRARGHLHVRWSRQSRAAADRRPAHRAAEALVGRDRCVGQEARRDGHYARAAARLRRVPHQGVRRRPHGRLRAREGLLGPRSQCERRPRQFRRAALRILPRFNRRAGSLQGRRARLALGEFGQELGDRLRFSGGEGQARGAGGIPEPRVRPDAGLRAQYAAREILRSARRALR